MSGAKDSFECDVFRGPCHWNAILILKEINKEADVLQTFQRNVQPFCCYIFFVIFSHRGLANVNIWERMVYPHCYIPSFPARALTEH